MKVSETEKPVPGPGEVLVKVKAAHCKTIQSSIIFYEIALGAAHFTNNPEAQKDLATMNEELAKLVIEGNISTKITEKVDLHEVPAALIKLSERHVKGKIVAVI